MLDIKLLQLIKTEYHYEKSWAFKRFFKLWLNMIQLNSKFMSVKWCCRIRGAIQVKKHSMIYFSVIRSWHKFEYGWENHFFFTWIQVLLVNTSKCSWYDSKCFWYENGNFRGKNKKFLKNKDANESLPQENPHKKLLDDPKKTE